MLKNSNSRFGSVAIALHWLIALIIFGEFGLGLFMTGLDYHHPMYQLLPELHESFGVLVGVLLLIRLLWGCINIQPEPESGVGVAESKLSKWVKRLMNLLIAAIFAFGYLLSTAQGDSISVFDLFYLPAIFEPIKGQEDISIFWHYWLAWTIIGFACLHTLGALKHHFFDKDETLRRIFGLSPRT